jgi:hypothetical protein
VERIHGPNADDTSDTTDESSSSTNNETTVNTITIQAHGGSSGQLTAIPPTTGTVTRDFGSNSGNEAKSSAIPDVENERKDINETTPTLDHDGKFHALVWYTTLSQKGTHTTQSDTKEPSNQRSQDLSAFLDRMNEKLLKHGHRKDKKAYRDSEPKSLPEVALHLLSVTRDINQTDGYINKLSTLDTFFVAAVQVFELFLDLRNDSEVAQRYWGAVLYIMRVCVYVIACFVGSCTDELGGLSRARVGRTLRKDDRHLQAHILSSYYDQWRIVTPSRTSYGIIPFTSALWQSFPTLSSLTHALSFWKRIYDRQRTAC